MSRLPLVALLVCLATVGCEGSLRIHAVTSVARPPANVILLCDVEDDSGPVVGLSRDSFTVSEDGHPVADWRLANPNLQGRMHTLLLLDFGGTLPEATRSEMAAAARVFADVMKDSGKLAIYVFDGSPTPHEIAPFSESIPEEAFQKLDSFTSRDQSVDLFSAYRSAYDVLAGALAAESVGVGALVLVSRGPDRAARASQRDVERQIEASAVRVPRLAVGVGPDAKNAPLASLSTVPPSYVEQALDLAQALFAVGERVMASKQSHYVISYCSDARAGDHRVVVEVKRTITDAEGKPREQAGRLSQRFSANGFGGGCEPTIPPELGGPPVTPVEGEPPAEGTPTEGEPAAGEPAPAAPAPAAPASAAPAPTAPAPTGPVPATPGQGGPG